MYAITPKGIGKKVGMRKVKPNTPLAQDEIIVDSWDENMVLAEDGISLRQGTNEELNPPVAELTNAQKLEQATGLTIAEIKAELA